MTGIVKRLREVMLQRKINQKELAAIADVTDRTISRWMCGKVPPSLKSLRKITDTLEINFIWLLDGKGLMNFIPGRKLNDEELCAIYKLDPVVIDIETQNERSVPVVSTYDDLDYQLHFYCIHCRCWHQHGRGGPDYPYQKGRGGLAGHTEAHCSARNSPFKKHGVILDVQGEYSEGKKRYRNGKALMCPKCHSYYSAAFNTCECGFVNKARKSKYPEIAKIYQKHPIKGTTAPTVEQSSGDYIDISSLPSALRSEIRELLSKATDIIASTDQDRQTLTNTINSLHQSLRKEQEIADYKKKTSNQDKRLANLEREMAQLTPIKEKKDIAS